ncbi:MAG: heat shock protein Hsp20, family protein [Candidatus Berkelbacteria bacterium]|nr:heat shock protein Hsp20, family protein [Candidatus Berkelbacteria bacterium]
MIKIYIHRVSRRIKNLREGRDLTQEALADQLGISRQSIISVEKGKCLPSLPLALRIAEIFNTSLESIFLGANNPALQEKKEGDKMPRFIAPWSPFGDLDRFFDEDLPIRPRIRGFQFPMINVKHSDKDITVTADIPGLKEEDLNIEVGDTFVDISGERKEEITEEDEGFVHQEVRYGSFVRRIPLPTKVDAEKTEATIKDGQLKIVIPKLEPEKPKVTKIKVKKA